MSVSFQLHLITEPRRPFEALLAAIDESLRGGVDWVQLRDKQAPAAAYFEQACALRRVTREHRARLTINDRLDVALAAEADGVHLAGQSLPVAAAAALAAGKLRLGRSVHSLDEAVAAAAAGADYVTFGHMFPTNSKPGLPPHGLAELAEIVQAVNVPVLAIGGITRHNLDDVLATGCAGIAVISAILSAPNPHTAAAELRSALDRSPHRPHAVGKIGYGYGEPKDAPDRQPTTV